MGADYYARACIGIAIPRNKCFSIRRVKTFEHSFPDDWKVDPKTGMSLWKNINFCGLLGDDQESSRIAGFRVFFDGYDRASISTAFVTRVFTSSVNIGEGSSEGGDIAYLDVINISQEEKALEKALRPFGLWDRTRFGLWVIPSVSV